DHQGRFPAGEPTSEASLGLLYPDYAPAGFGLGGKSVRESEADEVLRRGGRLGPESCGWYYVEGLTLNDDPGLAILWDKVSGLAENGQRRDGQGREVLFVCGLTRHVKDSEWDAFLDHQIDLMRKRDEYARTGKPILMAKVRLPSGIVLSQVTGTYSLDESWTGGLASSHSGTNPRLRWYRNGSKRLEDGTTGSWILRLPGK